ncbi:unnamed protein product [Phytophthora lilii]|uniref:Unnamed protein product n=1 Tax=Phytophthora lilii TaxID=2077276 RepID=A0A9W6WS45_9STRA|nr:unnamed protein product [Phytophthora lilii]
MEAASTNVTEASITFHGEPWTAEAARLLLEVDEGWVGYHHATAWSWRDETYAVFAAICEDRKWPCNSQAACVAMLQALRSGAIRMKLSSGTRTLDGRAQWALQEMRELGAQMRRVADGQLPAARWPVQVATFVEAMKAKDPDYSIQDRTSEDFAARASKYVYKSILVQMNTAQLTPDPVAKTNPAVKAKKLEKRSRRTTRARAEAEAEAKAEAMEEVDSDDEPLATLATSLAKTRSSRRIKKRRRQRSAESDGDSSYHDPTSEDEEEMWEAALRESETDSMPDIHELTSQGELVPVIEPKSPSQSAADQSRPSLPPGATEQVMPSSAACPTQPSPRGSSPSEKPSSPCQDELIQGRASPRQAATSLNGHRSGGTPTGRSSQEQEQVPQQQNTNSRSNGITGARSRRAFRSLNPCDRPGKPWGEFVVEVLLAERTARNDDELDYVRFVRGLYEI